MKEEERKAYFVEELDNSDNIDTKRWCDNCKHSYAFHMDGMVSVERRKRSYATIAVLVNTLRANDKESRVFDTLLSR